jgi:hypothetical protein
MPGGVTPEIKFKVCQANNCSEMVITDISDYGSYLPTEISTVELTVEKPTSYSTGVLDITSDIVLQLTGTVTCNGTTAVTGTLTAFLTELAAGDRIFVVGTSEYHVVSAVYDDTNILLETAATASVGSVAIRKRDTITMTPEDLGLSTTFDDGTYYMFVEYTMTDTTEHSFEREYFFHCHVTCGVYKMISQIRSYYNCTGCNQEFIMSATMVHGMYMGMIWDAARCNFTQALTTLDTLNNIIEFNRCNCE